MAAAALDLKMSRPQIGIDRLPARRMSNEPREAMNCKSCRKRKIKCNRLKPTCEACQIFACPCIYDAVPKKRGPKTDVLEALLKRVDGLEKRLKTEDKDVSPTTSTRDNAEASNSGDSVTSDGRPPKIEIPPNVNGINEQSAIISPAESAFGQPTPTLYPEILLDIYFSRLHGKPLHILDEISTRQRLQSNQLPNFLAFAIYALSVRYASQFGGYSNAVRVGHDYYRRARMELDVDEPSIESLQALLLLTQAAFQQGKGKKAYMHLTTAISMAFALNLHRELPSTLRVTPAEREGRRRLFWACYVLDRFSACGSKRPTVIADECIVLRLPAYSGPPGGPLLEGEYFPGSSNANYMAQPGKPSQGSTGLLIGIVRILGITNRYLAAGGVKGDSHFPWHSLSNLSKIRQDLDVWASETQDTFTSLETLFGQPDSTILVLSKLIYHLIHCLIYRPFLPVDLAELSGTSQHQSWQIEATNLCFLHANAIAELVEIGKASQILDWPAFVGYCVSTAGTIHVHGAHYRGQNGEVFSTSQEFLSRELQQLSELRYIWAGIQHQRDTLHTVYSAHAELVKSLASNPMRFSPVFHLEDFFDRYPGHFIDGGHFTFQDIAVDTLPAEGTPTYPPTSQPNHFRSPSMSTPTFSQNYFMPSGSVIPSTPQMPPRKRRTTDTNSVQSQDMNGIPPEAAIPSLPSSTQFSANPFSPLPNGFSPAFSFSPLPSNSKLPSDQNYDPTFSMPAPPEFQAAESSSGGGPPEHGHHHHLTSAASGAGFADHQSQQQQQQQQMTPTDTGSVHTDPDKDPFLSLLEQLAENEHSRGGPSELDFFLSASAG